jgi:hypothetical protein
MLKKDQVLGMIVDFLKDNDISLEELSTLYRAHEASTAPAHEFDPTTKQAIAAHAEEGRWDLVLPAVQSSLADEALSLDIFEHVFRVLVLARDLKSAARLLEKSSLLAFVCLNKFPDRHAALGRVLSRKERPFEGGERGLLAERKALAARLSQSFQQQQAETQFADFSLLALLQRGLGIPALPAAAPSSQLASAKRTKSSSVAASFFKFGKAVHVTCTALCGEVLAVGTSDGLVG